MDISMVDDGQVEAVCEQVLNINNVAAGPLIAQEAGASVTDFKGKKGVFPKQILVTNGKLLDQILPLM
jgi:myo-inositol-1(or 4)-monophosphatase